MQLNMHMATDLGKDNHLDQSKIKCLFKYFMRIPETQIFPGKNMESVNNSKVQICMFVQM